MSCAPGQCGTDVVTRTGMRFCIEEEVSVAWSSPGACQVVGTITKNLMVSESGWTNENWTLDKIVDNADVTKEYTWTTSSITGQATIGSVTVNFPNPTEFDGQSSNIRFTRNILYLVGYLNTEKTFARTNMFTGVSNSGVNNFNFSCGCQLPKHKFNECYPQDCVRNQKYFSGDSSATCEVTCPRARSSYQGCNCQTAPNLIYHPLATTASCQSSCDRTHST